MKKHIKAEIARRNGALSNGPVSIEGRRRASRNAIKHGLASPNPSHLCTTIEDQARLDALTARWIAKLQPRDEAELELVHEIAAHRWRLTRAWSIETATLDTEMDIQAPEIAGKFESEPDHPVRLAEAWRAIADNSATLENLGRYEFRLRRQFERALADYLRLRELPGEAEDPAAAAELPRAA